MKRAVKALIADYYKPLDPSKKPRRDHRVVRHTIYAKDLDGIKHELRIMYNNTENKDRGVVSTNLVKVLDHYLLSKTL